MEDCLHLTYSIEMTNDSNYEGGYTFYRALPNKGDTIEEKNEKQMDRLRFKRDCRQFTVVSGCSRSEQHTGAVSFTKDLSSSKSIQHKISDSVKKRFEKNDKVTFLIKFKEKANTKKAVKEAEKMPSLIRFPQQKPNIKSGQPLFLL